MRWRASGFSDEKRAVFARLADDRAWQEWKDQGGVERLKQFFTGLRISNEAPIPDEYHQRIYERLRRDGRFISTGSVVAETNGTLYPRGDADEAPLIDVEAHPDLVLTRERFQVMIEIMQRETGNAMQIEKAAEAFARRNELREVDLELACRLEGQGVPVFRNTPFDLFVYYIHSGIVVRQEQMRRIMFLPGVAARVRAPLLKQLSAFIQDHPYARMFTFTSGPRTLLYRLRDEIKDFHRALSKLAWWMRHKWGVEMVFRSTELGRPEVRADGADDARAGMIDRDEQGRSALHVHAHTLVWQRRPMKKDQWARFMRAVWKKWGGIWDDGRAVRDVRELCKYVTKPKAVLELTDPELAELYLQLRGLKLICAMGTLKETIRTDRENQQRLDHQPTHDGRIWRRVPDWNRHRPKPASDPETERLHEAASMRSATEGPVDMPARIVSRGAPSFAPGSLVSEPTVTVLSMGWRPREVVNHPVVQALRTATEVEWMAAMKLHEHADLFARASAHAPALSVHTSTSTVPAAGWLPGLAPPGCPAEVANHANAPPKTS